MVDVQALVTKGIDLSMKYLPKILIALIIFCAGWLCINWLSAFVSNRMKKLKVDRSLRPFMTSMLTWALRVLLIITVLSSLGIAMTSFIAILGAAGLAVGLALQGSLANFAGGVLIIMLKPFRVGDFIEAQGVKGDVTAIHVFNTIVTTKDNKVVIIPNGELSNHVITNFTANKTRRVDMVFGIGYEDDFEKARKIIFEIAKKDKRVLKSPAPMSKVGELADSSVNLTTRFWCKTEDYWNVYFDTHEAVKKAFDKEKISIPFPQRDVHLHEG
ncbi:MAG: mechanosensitive ion channel [Candidatus Woesearchaeota archaeon]|nr:mechanosensitive ion channel [Candidatus Woesearchaeota archaeon]